MIRKKQPKEKIVIDLTGPEGNAFVLLGYARRFAQQVGFDVETVIAEMTEYDYEHLVETFDQYFGSFVILER
jgi:hypothetical protein